MRGPGGVTVAVGRLRVPGFPHRAMQRWMEKMSSESTASTRGAKFRKDLDREAVGLAMKGEWERAAEVNRAILELFAEDVEAMNRLDQGLDGTGQLRRGQQRCGPRLSDRSLQQHSPQESRSSRPDAQQFRGQYQARPQGRRRTAAVHRRERQVSVPQLCATRRAGCRLPWSPRATRCSW